MANFVLILLLTLFVHESQQVTLSTHQYAYYVGDVATFTCLGFSDEIRWVLNGTQYYNTEANVEIEPLRIGSILYIYNITQDYNNSVIICETDTSTSNEIVVLLQGFLDAVSHLTYNLSNNVIKELSWVAPYTLDVPFVDPDITYCVDINSPPKLIYSKCGINKTFHICKSCPRLLTCAYYTIEVTAVNNVGSGSIQQLQVQSQDFRVMNFNVMSTGLYKKLVQVNSSQSTCLPDVRVKADEDNAEVLGKNESSIIEFKLNDNKHYRDVIVNVNNFGSSLSMSLGPISTYDVIEMSAVPSINGIDIYFNFVQNTNSKGVLVVLIYVYNGIANFTRSVYSPVGRADANNGYFFNNISSGNYCIYVYDIEFDGHLQAFGSPALYNHSVLIRGSDEGNHSLYNTNCQTESEGFTISITCSCDGFYQVLIQRNSRSLQSLGNITSKREACYSTTIFKSSISGIFWATVFHERANKSILDTSVFFSAEIEVKYNTPLDLSNSTLTTIDGSDVGVGPANYITYVVVIIGLFVTFLITSITLILALYATIYGKKLAKFEDMCCCGEKDRNIQFQAHFNRNLDTLSYVDPDGTYSRVSSELHTPTPNHLECTKVGKQQLVLPDSPTVDTPNLPYVYIKACTPEMIGKQDKMPSIARTRGTNASSSDVEKRGITLDFNSPDKCGRGILNSFTSPFFTTEMDSKVISSSNGTQKVTQESERSVSSNESANEDLRFVDHQMKEAYNCDIQCSPFQNNLGEDDLSENISEASFKAWILSKLSEFWKKLNWKHLIVIIFCLIMVQAGLMIQNHEPDLELVTIEREDAMASTNIFGPLDKICLKKSVVSGERDGYDDESDEDNFNEITTVWYDTFLIARTRKPQEKSSKMLFITLKMLLELSSQDDLRFNEPMKAMRNNNDIGDILPTFYSNLIQVSTFKFLYIPSVTRLGKNVYLFQEDKTDTAFIKWNDHFPNHICQCTLIIRKEMRERNSDNSDIFFNQCGHVDGDNRRSCFRCCTEGISTDRKAGLYNPDLVFKLPIGILMLLNIALLPVNIDMSTCLNLWWTKRQRKKKGMWTRAPDVTVLDMVLDAINISFTTFVDGFCPSTHP